MSRKIREGFERKGGRNDPPTRPRPAGRPQAEPPAMKPKKTPWRKFTRRLMAQLGLDYQGSKEWHRSIGEHLIAIQATGEGTWWLTVVCGKDDPAMEFSGNLGQCPPVRRGGDRYSGWGVWRWRAMMYKVMHPIDAMLAARREAGYIRCPQCGHVQDWDPTDMADIGLITYHGDAGAIAVWCDNCDREFQVRENVRRTFDTAKVGEEFE